MNPNKLLLSTLHKDDNLTEKELVDYIKDKMNRKRRKSRLKELIDYIKDKEQSSLHPNNRRH